MNRIARMLLVSGLGLVAGVTFGAGPAMAATSADTGASAGTTKVQVSDRDDDVVAYFDSLRACRFVGERGERRDNWDDYDCNFVRWGSHRGDWALEVSGDWDDAWANDWDDDWGHRGFPHRPFFPHRPGHFPGGPHFPHFPGGPRR